MRVEGEVVEQVCAEQDTQDADYIQARAFEGTREFRMFFTENHNAGDSAEECEQCTSTRHFSDDVDRSEASQDGYDEADSQGNLYRRTGFFVDVGESLRQQTITAHGSRAE